MMRFEQTDGGKAASGSPGERRDCSVRALALAANIPYDKALAAMAEAGREPGRGAYRHQMAKAYAKFGATPSKTKWGGLTVYNRQHPGRPGESQVVRIARRQTIAQFVAEHRRGKYVLLLKDHAAALVDGILKDSRPNLVGSRRRVLSHFKFP